MKILVASGDTGTRCKLKDILEKEGHRVIETGMNGELLPMLAREYPEMVLMDKRFGVDERLLPALRSHALQHFVLVALIDTLREEKDLEKIVEAQADDFIEIPFNALALKAKIRCVERFSGFYHDLEKFKIKTEQEIKLARHMFESITRFRRHNGSLISSWSWPSGHFSGDVLVSDMSDDGMLYVMLGDFTGHGLSAAVAAIPAADTFFNHTLNGGDVGEIVTKINNKLYDLLPVGHFCSACLLALDFAKAQIYSWNGGLPAVLLLGEGGKVERRITSEHLPLGILSPDEFDPAVETITMHSQSSVILYSDGLIEASNSRGEMFGETTLLDTLQNCSDGFYVEAVKKKIISFTEGLDPSDDISLVSLSLN